MAPESHVRGSARRRSHPQVLKIASVGDTRTLRGTVIATAGADNSARTQNGDLNRATASQRITQRIYSRGVAQHMAQKGQKRLILSAWSCDKRNALGVKQMI